MRRFVAITVMAGLLAGAAPGVYAKEEVTPDGVVVDKMSPLRNLVSEEELEAAATQQYAQIKQQAAKQNALAPADHPELVRLRGIANKIIPQASRWNERAAKWPWEINLIGSKDINAFCMPGGKIAFFTGILSNLKLTDDEVAIVMGHEIAHALREHGRERAATSALSSAGAKLAGIGLSAILGIDPNLTTAATGGIANLAMLKFSRSDETEADVVGLDIVARSGFDPRAGVTLWQKMAAVGNNSSLQWLSTHPAGNARIAEIQKRLPQVMPLYAKAKGVSLDALPPYESNVKGIGPVR
jgi:predicted Zn-dependent protease